MNCVNHPEVAHSAFCIRCGRPLCEPCVHKVSGSVYCETCLADIVRGRQQTAETVAGTSPGAAFALGLIPGIGAIYNGEFFKAAIHLLIFGTLVSIVDNAGPMEPLFGLLTFGFYAYMPFEAYYTAKKRKLGAQGIALETPFDRLNQQLASIKNKELLGGSILVGIGVLILLDNFGFFRFRSIGQFWPLVLIGAGLWLITQFKQKEG